MNYSIQYLAHLVHKKNELNLRRRRFWNLAYANHRWKTIAEPSIGVAGKYQKIHLKLPKCFSEDFYAVKGYEQAKRDMRAMTKHMREVRKELGASFTWDNSGNIQFIEIDEYAMDITEINIVAWQYGLDMELAKPRQHCGGRCGSWQACRCFKD